MKKVFSWLQIIIAVLLIISLAACQSSTGTTTDTSSAATSEVVSTEPRSEPVNISIWAPVGRFTDVDRQDAVKRDLDYGLIEKKFNIRIKYTTVPTEQARDQIGIMLATNALTDIIYMPGAYDTFLVRPDQMFTDRQIIDLKTIESSIPEYMKIINSNPVIMKNVMDDAGHIMYFSIPLFEQELGMSGGLMIRKDWLDKFKLPLPQSLDDFLTALRTFREKDANGNNKKDEIPFCGSHGSLNVIGNLTGVQELFSMKGGSGGNVVFGPFEEEAYKTRLKLINIMASEKLINENYYNFDFKMRDTWIAEDKIGAALTGLGNLDKWNAMMKDHPTFLMWPIDNPKQPDGNRYFDRTDMSKSMRHEVTMITTAAKNPELCGKLINYFYTNEGNMLNRFGVEGITYKMEGDLPRYTELITRNSNNLSVGDARLKYIGIIGMPYFEDMSVWSQLSLTSPAARQANIHTWTDTFTEKTNTPIPPAMMTPKDAAEFADIMADLKTYVQESVAKFTTGEWNIDKEYAGFAEHCHKLKADRALELQDKAIKAWQARGGVPYKFTLERAKINYWSSIPFTTEKGIELMDPALK